ncbi:MAG: Fic/DOC family N-terminal domain-containing protein [Patescibacteria group bacterium]
MNLKKLPPDFDFDTLKIVKASREASVALAELNGLIYGIPNYELLLSPLTVREAVASSEIENIRTTTLDILQAEISSEKITVSAQKETINYKVALLKGYEIVKQKGFLATNDIVEIQRVLEPNKSGIRNQMGTVIADGYGNIVHTPPQQETEIRDLLADLDFFINNYNDGIDPLVKLAIIHYQFETIHPFFDGNGRTGRILMILYLVLVSRLHFPVLFLSGYILNQKVDYYRLLQEVRTVANWSDWVLFVLKGIEIQSKETSLKVKKISDLKLSWKKLLKEKYAKIYSINLLDYLFNFAFYTQTHFSNNINVSRPTASKYLDQFVKDGYLKDKKSGKEKIFFIPEFIEILS